MSQSTYIRMLKDILLKKIQILDEISILVELQGNCLEKQDINLEEFEEVLPKKEILIENLNQLDEGFEKIFEKAKDGINENKLIYKENILEFQELIQLIIGKSTRIQLLEKRNKELFEVKFTLKKKEIKQFKINSNTANSYYKNMANSYQGDSFFLDKKK